MTTIQDRLFGTFIGIEFKEDSLVISHLKNNLSGILLLSSSSFVLRNDDEFITEVKEYLSRYTTGAERVFVCLPDTWAVTKFIDVPATKTKGSLAQLMNFEIERHIPFEISNVVYDFQIVDEKESTFSVSFIAVRKGKVEYVKEILKKLSLKPDAITISSFAVMNALELSGSTAGGWQDILGLASNANQLGRKGETNINLYLDNTHASLAIIKSGLCVNLRFFNLEEYDPREEFIDEAAKFLIEVQSRYRIESFNHLILSGDYTGSNSFAEDLGSRLKAHEVVIENIRVVEVQIKDVKLTGQLASVGACYAGLGMGTYRANLLPHKMDYEVKRMASLTMKIFIALIIVLGILIFTTEAVQHRKYLARMDEVLAQNEPQIKELLDLSTVMANNKKHIQFIDSIVMSEITLEILSELAATVPKDTWLTNLHYKGFAVKEGQKDKDGGELIVQGFADSSSILLPLLEDSPYFEKVEFVGPIKKAKDKEQFKLNAKIVRPVEDEKEK